MDLNQALEQDIQTLSLERATELVSFSLQWEKILAQLERSKRFELLPAFLPILQLDLYTERCHELARVYAQCLLEEDKESVQIMDKYLSKYLHKTDVAFWYGKICKECKLPSWAEQKYLDCCGYLMGLAAADNLDLFLQARSLFFDKPSKRLGEAYIYRLAATYCAVKILDHLGYAQEPLGIYVDYCIHEGDLKTLEFLFTRVEDTNLLIKLLKEKQNIMSVLLEGGDALNLFRTCLAKGWLVFSEAEWKQLKEKNPRLHQQLQADV